MIYNIKKCPPSPLGERRAGKAEIRMLMPFLVLFGAISFVNFIMYGVDKLLSKGDARRIPEKVLLWTSMLGGAAGGGFAMLLLRHKTKHWYFIALNIIGFILQMALLAFFYMIEEGAIVF